MSQKDINIDTKVRGYLTSLLNVTLNYNSQVIGLAAILISAGPIKASAHKKAVADLQRFAKQAQTDYDKIIAEYQKDLAEWSK